MKPDTSLYYSRKEDIYYYIDDTQTCAKCGQYITDTIFIQYIWDNLWSGIRYFCNNCRKHIQKDSAKIQYSVICFAIIEYDLPKDAIVCIPSKPDVDAKTGAVGAPIRNITTHDAAVFGMDGEAVIDKTVYANKESWHGVDVGALEYKNIDSLEGDIDLKIGYNPMSDDELDHFFDDINNSTPILPGPNDKRVLR